MVIGHDGHMARAKRQERVDPTWPQLSEEDHPVSELASDRQGALSPFGDLAFPLPADQLPYEHPVTIINR
jgi:hypothetical protein